MRYLYTFLFYLALPFVLLRLVWRSRRLADYRRRWCERFGVSPHQLESCIWVHAVSVGETIAAIPLIKALKADYPTIPLLITNMTPTGAARVKAAFGDSVLQAYIPYDLPGAVKLFLKRIQPKIAIIMETELWPNLFAACKQANVPVVIVNARLSPKSANGYKRIGMLTREIFTAITALASQGKADAERFIELGMPKDKVTVTGNIKFDIEVPAELAAKSNVLREQLGDKRLIWIAASTHPSEEEIVLHAHKKIREKHPEALLILVPRHPDRFDGVAQLVEQQGFTLARRSRNDRCLPETAVYLGDTMGELLLMYAVSDVAVIAGSFAGIGGHNMLEAAVLGKPVITGPQLFNFAEISDMLLLAEGMIKVQDGAGLAENVNRLFADESYRDLVGKNGFQVVAQNRGALRKQLELIKEVLG